MNLCSAIIAGLALACGSACKVAIGGPDLNPVVFLGMSAGRQGAEGVLEGEVPF